MELWASFAAFLSLFRGCMHRYRLTCVEWKLWGERSIVVAGGRDPRLVRQKSGGWIRATLPASLVYDVHL